MIEIINNNIEDNANKLYNKFIEADDKAKTLVGLQLLNNVINGSPPNIPVKTGLLQSSGSVFVGSKLIAVSENICSSGKPPTPATSNDDDRTVIVIGFNTPYAARIHETRGKFLEMHIQNDMPDLLLFYVELLKKEIGI